MYQEIYPNVRETNAKTGKLPGKPEVGRPEKLLSNKRNSLTHIHV